MRNIVGGLHPGEKIENRVLVGEQIAKGGFSRIYGAVDLDPLDGPDELLRFIDGASVRGPSYDLVVKEVIANCVEDLGLDEYEYCLGLAQAEYSALVAAASHRIAPLPVLFVNDYWQRVLIVMEKLEGVTLRDLMSKVELTSFSIRDLCLLFIRIAMSVDFVHFQGYLHLDLKPRNIHVLGNEEVRVLDFGCAKTVEEALRPSQIADGTPAYMAPEQWNNNVPLTKATDIYALGGIFYEMLSGELPFEFDDYAFMRDAHINDEPIVIPGVPDELMGIVLKMLAKDPSERYRDVPDLLCDLNVFGIRYLDGAFDLFDLSRRESPTGFTRMDYLRERYGEGLYDYVSTHRSDVYLDRLGGGTVIKMAKSFGDEVMLGVLRSSFQQYMCLHRLGAYGRTPLPQQLLIDSKGRSVLSVERVGDMNLRDYWEQEGMSLSLKAVLELILGVLDCLIVVHGHGLVMRDVKPENFTVGDGSMVTLVDLDLFCEKNRGVELDNICGTPPYIAPEVWKGEVYGVGGDLFAVGVMLYEFLAGRRPFDGCSMPVLVHEIVNKVPNQIQGLHPELMLIIDTMLEKDPRLRFASANGVRTAIKSFALCHLKARL